MFPAHGDRTPALETGLQPWRPDCLPEQSVQSDDVEPAPCDQTEAYIIHPFFSSPQSA